MPDKEIVPTTHEHILALSKNMRDIDKNEIWASSHATPLQALETGFNSSEETFSSLYKGQVACIFGVATDSLLSDVGRPWLLSNDMLFDHKYTFLRMTRVYVNAIKNRYEVLENFVDCRNSETIKWLAWSGFKIHDPAPYGLDQLLFCKFDARR